MPDPQIVRHGNSQIDLRDIASATYTPGGDGGPAALSVYLRAAGADSFAGPSATAIWRAWRALGTELPDPEPDAPGPVLPPPAPTPSVPRSSVYDPHANGNNGIRGADMPRSPQEVLAAREAAERSKVDELQNAIEAKITDVISGFSGAPWSYFIDTTRYSHSVVMRVRMAFAEAGWDVQVGDPSDDPRDTGYHLVFKEGDPSNRR